MAYSALLIGNQVFDKKDDLHTPANNVEDLAHVLRQHSKFEIQKTLVNANFKDIKEQTEKLFNRAKRGDLILFYYSGHGHKDKRGKLHLMAKDTDPDLVLTTGISVDFIRDAIDNSNSRHRIIILDCCFSGAILDGTSMSGDEPVPLERLKGEAVAILASSGKVQYSFEEDGWRNSLYTQYLLEGIRTGRADKDKDGEISILELHEYAQQKVRNRRYDQSPVAHIQYKESNVYIAEAIPRPFIRFSSDEEALSLNEWVHLAERNWIKATELLYDTSLEEWLVKIEEANLANAAKQIREKVTSDHFIGLEQFQRLAGGFKPHRKTDAHTNLNELIGELNYWKLRQLKKSNPYTLTITNRGKRGYLHGEVSTSVDWIHIPNPRFGCLPGDEDKVIIEVDPTKFGFWKFSALPLKVHLE